MLVIGVDVETQSRSK